MQNEAVITGIGLVTSAGVGADANWQALSGDAMPVIDADRFAPVPIHPAPEIDWSEQIPRRGDQRQMEAWQRLGTFSAGLALDDAGMKGDEALTGTMDMIVAAGGGERDIEVDTMILAEAAQGASDLGVLVNEKLTTELRPTLFLAQLSNLLAGNISIVHKVTGSSRTFMGEEGAGISAVQTAVARIGAGQSTHALVGGSYNCEHPDMLLSHHVSHSLHSDAWAPVFARQNMAGGGVVPGSGGAFIVIEEREHAQARGAKIYARIGPIFADCGRDDATGSRLAQIGAQAGLDGADMIVSAATGAHGRAAAEQTFLHQELTGKPSRAIANLAGSWIEAQFPLAIAAAALSIKAGQPIAARDTANEAPFEARPENIGVLALGQRSGEAALMVSALEDR